MSEIITIPCEVRKTQGKGASRRLRHEGLVPGILYGGDRDPVNLQIPHRFLFHALENEAFYTSVMELEAGEKRQKVILRDLQRHPFKPLIMHIDFQRIDEKSELRMLVPLHFINEAKSPAGKKSGVVISHQMTELAVSCLPKNLPEFIEVDLAELEVGDIVHLGDITLPEGVKLIAHDDELGTPVVTTSHITAPKTTEEEGAPEAPAAPQVGEEGEEGETEEDEG